MKGHDWQLVSSQKKRHTESVVFLDLLLDGQPGLADPPLEENALLEATLDDWINLERMTAFLKARGLERSFFSLCVLQEELSGGPTAFWNEERLNDFGSFRLNAPLFPELRDLYCNGQLTVELHSLGVVLPSSGNKALAELKQDSFSIFAGVVFSAFAPGAWKLVGAGVPRFGLCNEASAVPKPVKFDEKRCQIYEIPVHQPYRPRYGHYAAHCMKQMEFYQRRVLKVDCQISPCVLYFGHGANNRGWDLDALHLKQAFASAEQHLKSHGWKEECREYGTHDSHTCRKRWYKDSVFVLCSGAGVLHVQLKAEVKRLLQEFYQMNRPGVADWRSFYTLSTDEVLAALQDTIELDLRNNDLRWVGKNGEKTLLALQANITKKKYPKLKKINLAHNALFGPKFVKWVESMLPLCSIDITDNPKMDVNAWRSLAKQFQGKLKF